MAYSERMKRNVYIDAGSMIRGGYPIDNIANEIEFTHGKTAAKYWRANKSAIAREIREKQGRDMEGRLLPAGRKLGPARRRNPSGRKPGDTMYLVSQQFGPPVDATWRTLAIFNDRARAAEYAKAIHKRYPGKTHKVVRTLVP